MAVISDQAAATMAEPVRISVRKASAVPMLLLAGVVLYLIYAWNAFDIGALLGRAQLSKGALLVSDSIAYKTHVTKNFRRGDLEVAIEGERNATYKSLPDWVRGDKDAFSVDLGYQITTAGDDFIARAVAFSSAPSTRFAAGLRPLVNDGVRLRSGLSLFSGSGLEVRTIYDGLFGKNGQNQNTVQAQLSVRF